MRWPVDRPSVTSGYGQRRANGVVHWGLDLHGKAGDVVRAPEPGFVVASQWGAGTAVKLPPPLDGYGPGAVLIRGQSGVWHLLAHLDPASGIERPFPGEPIAEGTPVGAMPRAVGAAGPHTHWEVRTHVPYDSPQTRQGNTRDPRLWLGLSGVVSVIDTAASAAAVVIDRAKANGTSSGGAWWPLLLLLFMEER